MEGNNTYILLKDALKSLKIKERALQTRCKKLGYERTKEGYKIPIDVFKQWSTNRPQTDRKVTANRKVKDRKPQTATATQTDLVVQSLENEIETLKQKLVEAENEINIPEGADSFVELDNGKFLNILTSQEQKDFEQRLKEWQTQRKELEHQEQLFTAEKKSLSERYEHYKHQYHYQQKQNEKVLEMHQRLLDIISSQSKAMQERNLIEAIEKDIVKKDTWKPK